MKKKTFTCVLCREWTRLVGNHSFTYNGGDIVTDLLQHEVDALRSIPGRVDEFTENVDETKPAAMSKK